MRIMAGNPDPDPSRPARQAPKPHDADGNAPVHTVTNAFSKKVENLTAAVSLHFVYYNFCRNHESLRIKNTEQPASANTEPRWRLVSLPTRWSLTQLAGLLD